MRDGLPAPGRPLFGWWTGSGGGAFLHTPPFPLVLNADPAAAALVARWFAAFARKADALVADDRGAARDPATG